MAVLGEGGVSLAPSYREALLYLLVLSTSQKAKGEGREHGQAGALLIVPAVWKRGPAAPWDDAPTSCLPSLSSLELPITCLLVLATTAAHHTVPITRSSSCPLHCPHHKPTTLSPWHAHQAAPALPIASPPPLMQMATKSI